MPVTGTWAVQHITLAAMRRSHLPGTLPRMVVHQLGGLAAWVQPHSAGQASSACRGALQAPA